MALLTWYLHYPWVMQRAGHLEFTWTMSVLVRNVFVIHMCYGGWHWFLYERQATIQTLRTKKAKFNPNNIKEDGSLDPTKGYIPSACRLLATQGAIIESIYECIMLHLWATGSAPVYFDYWSTPLWSVAWTLFVLYWRDFHFFFAHRLLHPWFAKDSKFKSFDLGQLGYRHCHSIHHRSYNTGPWSGLSMHWLEHIIYFSCVWVPSLWLPQHPIHFLFNHWHVLVSPLPGHDGYDQPIGGGSRFHYLHHAHFECNYGTPLVPLDILFGSYEDGSKYHKFGKQG